MKLIKAILLSFAMLFALNTAVAQDKTAGTALDKVTTAYFDLKNDLAEDNSAAAKTAGKNLLTAVNALKAHSLSAPQQKIWVAYLGKLQFDSKHISEAPSIEHQREHFANLSKNMSIVVSGSKANTTAVYEQYCPMKKASWLSESTEIKNPYYGKSMLTCGTVKETFAANVK
jgi:hypothetical protein